MSGETVGSIIGLVAGIFILAKTLQIATKFVTKMQMAYVSALKIVGWSQIPSTILALMLVFIANRAGGDPPIGLIAFAAITVVSLVAYSLSIKDTKGEAVGYFIGFLITAVQMAIGVGIVGGLFILVTLPQAFQSIYRFFAFS